MSKLNRYRVVRKHYGDKAYAVGDIRDAAPGEVAHLVPHVLELVGPAAFDGKGDHDGDGNTGGAAPAIEPAEKAEPEPLNKAEPAAPANKAASPRKSKRSR